MDYSPSKDTFLYHNSWPKSSLNRCQLTDWKSGSLQKLFLWCKGYQYHQVNCQLLSFLKLLFCHQGQKLMCDLQERWKTASLNLFNERLFTNHEPAPLVTGNWSPSLQLCPRICHCSRMLASFWFLWNWLGLAEWERFSTHVFPYLTNSDSQQKPNCKISYFILTTKFS